MLLGLLIAACVATAQPAAAASAPGPPLAYSGYASQTDTSSATISAAVNPRGLETSYFIQYGPTASYGTQTQPASTTGTTEVKLAESLTGLQANTTYHFRMVASNAAGTGFGPDRTFVTKKIPLRLDAAAANPNPDVFGSPFSVTGNLSGSEDANQALVLQINPFPYKRGFVDLGNPELSDAAGNFSFAVAPLAASAQLRVAALGPPIIYGPILIEHVSVHLSFHIRAAKRRGFYRLYGTVTPALAGAHLGFQWLGRDGKPVTVSGMVLKRATAHSSRFARTLRLRHRGRYRASVQSPTPALLSNHSRWVRLH